MTNQTRQYNIVVLVNKAKDNENITFSVTESESNEFLHANITGSVVEAKGLVHTEDNGASYDYSEDIKGLETLILVDKINLAEQIVSKSQAIFASRAERNDLNNRIYLSLVASGFRLDVKDESEEAADNRSKLWITNVISVEVTGGLSINAFKSRLSVLKTRTASRVKARSNGLFRPQQEVTPEATKEVKSTNASPELPSREEMFKQMVLMQQQMAAMQSQLTSSKSNGSSASPARDVEELVG